MNKFIIAALFSVTAATDFTAEGTNDTKWTVEYDSGAQMYTYTVKTPSGDDLWLAWGDSYETQATNWVQFKTAMSGSVVEAYGTKGFPRQERQNDYVKDSITIENAIFTFVAKVPQAKSGFTCDGKENSYGWVVGKNQG